MKEDSQRNGVNIAMPAFLAERLRAAIYALQGDASFRFKYQAHDRLIELGLEAVAKGAMPDIYGGRVDGGKAEKRSTLYLLPETATALEACRIELASRGIPWSEFTALVFRAIVVAAGCAVALEAQDASGLTGQV